MTGKRKENHFIESLDARVAKIAELFYGIATQGLVNYEAGGTVKS
jgi:hypothetical protein